MSEHEFFVFSYFMIRNKDKNLRILGIDPGFGRIGFGLIEGNRDKWRAVSYGCIETDPKQTFVERIEELHQELKKLIRRFRPSRAAVEELFFYKNVKTALQVGQARGVILLTLRQAGLPVDEFTPLEVKQALTGYGRADKRQMQIMARMLLGIKSKKIQDDAADALAVALTSGVSWRVKQMK